ncbi:MAG: hypothetical protein FWD53_02190, partial [Phycisphaerales bacterium]|nr:hypothetical protein [Phycisphaerales bacterium]
MPTASPTPSPWRTLTRTLLRSRYFLLAVALLWTAWYIYADHALNTRLAEYRNRNEPTTPADLSPPLPTGTNNAYEHLVNAITAMTLTPDEHYLVNNSASPTTLPLSPADMATARTMIERTAAPIATALEKARN